MSPSTARRWATKRGAGRHASRFFTRLSVRAGWLARLAAGPSSARTSCLRSRTSCWPHHCVSLRSWPRAAGGRPSRPQRPCRAQSRWPCCRSLPSPASPFWRRDRWRRGPPSICATSSVRRRSSGRWDRRHSMPRCSSAGSSARRWLDLSARPPRCSSPAP